MNRSQARVRCHFTLAEGKYQRSKSPATRASVSTTLRWVLSDSLCALEFIEPDEDVAVEGEAVVFLKSRYRDWGHDGIVCDRIITALVERLQPEFECMVEVEVLDA